MNPKAFHRKLAAILSADVAGYSRLMQDDEAATVKTVSRPNGSKSEIQIRAIFKKPRVN